MSERKDGNIVLCAVMLALLTALLFITMFAVGQAKTQIDELRKRVEVLESERRK